MKPLFQSALFGSFLVCSQFCQCAQTESGRPEVAITSTDVSAVKNAITRIALSAGYRLKHDSEMKLSFEGRASFWEDVSVRFNVGGSNSSQPMRMLEFTILRTDTDVRVVVDEEITTQSMFGQVNSMKLSGAKWFRETQAGLVAIKGYVERNGPPKALIGLHFNTVFDGTITKVADGLPAHKAGITPKSKIVLLNGLPFSIETVESEIRMKNPGDHVDVEWIDASKRSHKSTLTLASPK